MIKGNKKFKFNGGYLIWHKTSIYVQINFGLYYSFYYILFIQIINAFYMNKKKCQMLLLFFKNVIVNNIFIL